MLPAAHNYGSSARAAVMMAVIIVLPAIMGGTASRAQAQVISTPTPKVSAPPAGTRGFPFLSEGEDLAAKSPGYIEKEVFIEGTARSYVPVKPLADIADGRWDSTPTGPTAPYKTRLLIRLPQDPKKFNGTVIVDWMNVTAGHAVDGYMGIRDLIVREGYAWVGLDAQAVGVKYLPTWDNERYGSLNHPGDSYSFDILSQAAQVIRKPSPEGAAPLEGLTNRIKNLIAVGGSQSGSRLFTYINAVHPTVGLLDGFGPTVSTGGSALAQEPLAAIPTPTGAARVIRTDSHTPVLWTNSESEFIAGARGIHRQPDGPRFRLWELAGVAHGTAPAYRAIVVKLQRMAIAMPPQTATNNPGPAQNDVDNTPISKAAIAALKKWIETGRPPASAPRAELKIPADPAQSATIVRDPATGLAVGGIRLPDIAVPTRTVWGERLASAVPAMALNGGTDLWNGDSDPWDKTESDLSPNPEPSLATLYPSQAKYVGAVTASAKALVARGYMLEPEAKAIAQTAAQSGIGKRTAP